MTFDELKAAIMNLDAQAQRRVVLEVLPAMWPQIVEDKACLILLKKLIDAESERLYQEEHMDHL
jgi:hypothetical protein